MKNENKKVQVKRLSTATQQAMHAKTKESLDRLLAEKETKRIPLPEYLSHASYANLETIVANLGEPFLMLTDVQSVDLRYYPKQQIDVMLRAQFEGNMLIFRANVKKVQDRFVIGESHVSLLVDGEWQFNPSIPKGLLYTLQSLAHYELELPIN